MKFDYTLGFVRLLFPVISASFATGELNGEDSSLFWGTFRPNLYFGLRPRVPNSLMTGLMWHSLADYRAISETRHACEQGDRFEGYTWTEHDPRLGGIQVLNDTRMNVQLTTEWLKVSGGETGGSWAARISGKPIREDEPSSTAIYFYVGSDGLGSLELENEEDGNGIEGVIRFTGSTSHLGDFRLRIEDGPDVTYVTEGLHAERFSRKLGKTSFIGLPLQQGQVWKAKELLLRNIFQEAQPILSEYKDKDREPPSPAKAFCYPESFVGEFSFDIYYDAEDVKTKLDANGLTAGIKGFKNAFHERFLQKFPLPSTTPKDLIDFSKAITANLLGGIGYFYGTSIVDSSFTHDWDDDEMFNTGEKKSSHPALVEPRELFTATPSRSFFPRGFYWDEGFHLQLIGEWDNDLSLDILKSWVDLIDDDGWVGREQILGEEARSKVPPEFQTQYPTYANPPTLTMAVTAYIDRLRALPDEIDVNLGMDPTGQQVLKVPVLEPGLSAFHLSALRRHYHWFRRTQRGQIRQWGRKARSRTEAYRWRGRSETHVLTSGLDDYPRASLPHVGELHLDLISWMGFFTRTMRDIANLHWSEDNNMYCDVGIDEDDESHFVCHKGYISLFPFLLGLLDPNSPHLGSILSLIRDPDELWSPYGIRSLSKSHPLFGQGENYWRGPIWVQMNYLALSTLYKTYIPSPGPYQRQARDIYDELRTNIISNVFKEYQRTGYVWEQYDALTGEGKRSHPFTGWSSLVTLIMSEKY
ncbi:glycoside hydrolase family 63 protein [Cantharellus anzutake]|uniref:glycoside hydrolase family 63 protein n=1 Tax=Cantharellus anzutake TaxID=1750568 RepID=UPI001907C473|nr:glycoside hydrolase family 63 protein [Cantharellus anzutake]KAF8344136.1 glycoside hydrolase family 63 protein [Cantharellus anzutake]